MMLSRRRFLRDTALGALLLPVDRWFQLDDGPAPSPGDYSLEILPREEWARDDLPKGPLEAEDVRFLLVHHTASGNDYQPEDVPGLLRGFFRFHTGPEKGWPDIAYNFLIDRYGRVWEGRDGSLEGPMAGSATGGNQGLSQLVAVIGDFTNTLPTPEALDSLRRTLAWLADRYAIDTAPGAVTSFISRGSNRWPEGSQIDTSTIAGHRDMSLTACPGDAFYQYVVEGLAADVSHLRASAATTTSLSTTTTSPSTTLDMSSTAAGAAPTIERTDPPITSRTPLSTDPSEAIPSPEASTGLPGGIGLGGLSTIGAAAVAILGGLVALIRRRVSHELPLAAQSPGSRFPDPPGNYRFCVDCGQQNSIQNSYCLSCGADIESQRAPPS